MRSFGTFALLGALGIACSTTKPHPPPPVVDAGLRAPALDASIDAAVDGGVVTAALDASVPEAVDPFGVAKTSARAGCSVLTGNVAKKDIETSFVDGDDLLALVNRSPMGSLPPDYAPGDMVDIRNGKVASAAECEKVQCLRKDAATALGEILAQMKKEGFTGHVESAFRSYGTQCGTFGNWARKGSFCDATEQSALPGHSQHQLGTTVDLFTEEWAKDPRGVFREGFGCTAPGKWIREHATEFGFVMPYPIHPDDRHRKQRCTTRSDINVNINPKTGYRFEHWHIRYVGKDAAKGFKSAFDASDINGPTELTLEQWLRKEKGIHGADAELPICDTCNCGACGTLAEQTACDRKGGALHLDEHGLASQSSESVPSIIEITKGKSKDATLKSIDVKIEVPAGLLTQSPIAPRYAAGQTYESLAPFPDTAARAFSPLRGTWMIAIEGVPNDGVAWPYRAALATSTVGDIYNKANVVLPARVGKMTVRIAIPAKYEKAKVVLLKGGVVQGQERTADL